MGIEFSYAAETAFVSPTLLEIGVIDFLLILLLNIYERRLFAHLKKKTEKVSQRHMTLIWCLSPLVGFFLTPIMGRYIYAPASP